MPFSKKSLENYLMIDHRAGPGMPEALTERMGLPPLPAGKVVELATLTCCHCTTQVIINPNRQRERGYCQKCNAYVCDGCVEISRRPGYVHMPWRQVVDLVMEGKAIVLPGSTHGEPKLLFTS